MIIQCRKCGAKFRFDENLITKDGVWVRCSLCRHVFHQDSPRKEEEAPIQREAERPSDIATAVEKGDQDIAKAAEMPGARDDIRPEGKGDEAILSGVKEIGEAIGEEDLEFAVKKFEDLEDFSQEKSGEGAAEETVMPEKDRGKKKRSIGKFFAWFFILLIAFLLAGGLYLWIFPQSGQQVSQYLSPYCPVIEKIWGRGGISPEPIPGQVKIQDVRQHFVNNWLMGNIRVVEGTAVNTAGYPLTRIQMRGRLYDAENRVLAEQVSFCGNLLTDAELATFTEEEIQRKLALPQGSNVSNDRIIPDGLIPFMIVFVHDPPGFAKATVMTAGAEKLLE